jgi:hypothetical protein
MMKPSVGRIVHVYLENASIRPAIITRVGPCKVDEEDTGQVAYQLFFAPEDLNYTGVMFRVGHERVEGEEWKPGDWIWPPRV